MRAYSTTSENGNTLSQLISIHNQVAVFLNNKRILIESAELKDWIEKDWQDLSIS